MVNINTGGISIPDIGLEKAVDMTNAGRTQNVKRWVSKGLVKMGEPAIEVITITELTDQGLVEEVTVSAGSCASCGRQFKSDSDVGGVCSRCDSLVCHICLDTMICRICDQLVCSHCGQHTTLDGVPAFMCFDHKR